MRPIRGDDVSLATLLSFHWMPMSPDCVLRSARYPCILSHDAVCPGLPTRTRLL